MRHGAAIKAMDHEPARANANANVFKDYTFIFCNRSQDAVTPAWHVSLSAV